jgi:hypothetical protein
MRLVPAAHRVAPKGAWIQCPVVSSRRVENERSVETFPGTSTPNAESHTVTVTVSNIVDSGFPDEALSAELASWRSGASSCSNAVGG